MGIDARGVLVDGTGGIARPDEADVGGFGLLSVGAMGGGGRISL